MKPHRFTLFGTILIIVGIAYGVLQNAGYENRGVPHSTPEAICDLITVLIMLTGCIICVLGAVFDKGDEE